MTLNELVTTTRSLARTLCAMSELGVRNRHVYDEVLQEVVASNPRIYGSWTVWEPNALDQNDRRFRNHPGHDTTGRYLPFWFRDGGRMTVEPNTNYDKPGSLGAYYQIPCKTRMERTVRFSEYVPLSGKRHLFTCHIVPLMRSDRFLGVAGIDVEPEIIEEEGPAERKTLTCREREVLQWIAAGKTNAEIAVILGISIHTTKRHVERILEKLGVENRRGAMLAWLAGSAR